MRVEQQRAPYALPRAGDAGRSEKKNMRSIKYLLLLVWLALYSTSYAEQFKSFSITSADAARAKVVFSRNYPPVLEVVLRYSKAQELAELTRTGFNQKVIIEINGEVVAEPIVKSIITSGTLEVQIPDEKDAIRLAKSLMQETNNSEQPGPGYPPQGVGSPDP